MKLTWTRLEARQAINTVSPIKISFNDMIVKACSMALEQHPQINSSWLGDRIRFNDHIHIGVAMAVEDGLLFLLLDLPIVKDFLKFLVKLKTTV